MRHLISPPPRYSMTGRKALVLEYMRIKAEKDRSVSPYLMLCLKTPHTLPAGLMRELRIAADLRRKRTITRLQVVVARGTARKPLLPPQKARPKVVNGNMRPYGNADPSSHL